MERDDWEGNGRGERIRKEEKRNRTEEEYSIRYNSNICIIIYNSI